MRSEMKFYRSYRDAARMIDDPVERCRYYDQILDYGLDGIEPEVSGTAGAMFVLTKPTIDSYIKKSEAGAKGGASKPQANSKQTASKPQAKANEVPTNDNVNVNVNVNDNVNDKRTSVKRFTPPTAEEVQAYCNERNNGVDGQHFVDYYEARGWKIGGKQPMKDWKAAVRTWERSGYNKPQTANTSTGAFQYGEAELAAIRALKRGRTNT